MNGESVEIGTSHGPARAHLRPVTGARGLLVLGHGAGGGVEAPDLLTASAVAGAASTPPTADRRQVIVVPGDHSLAADQDAVGDAVRAWLTGLTPDPAAR